MDYECMTDVTTLYAKRLHLLRRTRCNGPSEHLPLQLMMHPEFPGLPHHPPTPPRPPPLPLTEHCNELN